MANFDAAPAWPSPAPAAELSTAHLARLSGYRKLMEGWFKAIDVELLRRALEGDVPEGFKLVESRSRRAWASEPGARYLLETNGVPVDAIYSKIVSPAQGETLLRHAGLSKADVARLMAPMVFKPPGRQTLVPERDDRPALADDGEEFDAVA